MPLDVDSCSAVESPDFWICTRKTFRSEKPQKIYNKQLNSAVKSTQCKAKTAF